MKKLTCYTLAAVLASSFAASVANARMYDTSYYDGYYGYGYGGYTRPVGLGADVVIANDRVALDRARVRYDLMKLRADQARLRYDVGYGGVGYRTAPLGVVYYGPNSTVNGVDMTWW